ncbi:cytochrome b5-like isoform X2 [Gigantopelta aegis]|uniref:cytochrome b5-like isoform X2 n=1 Tax=Gigantopelta aegis TaxID=1735272 RepID=UPI001B88E1E1|nr:cytochrome b5-like isoform X2 [Gigantopelta aegis]
MGEVTTKKPLQLFTLKDVKEHGDESSCWIVIWDRVYDVTKFLKGHPGGEDIILEHAGHDSTQNFDDKGHSTIAHDMLEEYLIGELVQEDRRKKAQ